MLTITTEKAAILEAALTRHLEAINEVGLLKTDHISELLEEVKAEHALLQEADDLDLGEGCSNCTI